MCVCVGGHMWGSPTHCSPTPAAFPELWSHLLPSNELSPHTRRRAGPCTAAVLRVARSSTVRVRSGQ